MGRGKAAEDYRGHDSPWSYLDGLAGQGHGDPLCFHSRRAIRKCHYRPSLWRCHSAGKASGHNEVSYSEGQIVGYRWYDKYKVAPAFPFGFGLTYGSFQYSELNVVGRTISFAVAGKGCDTPQVYISYPGAESNPSVPNKVLRYFQKTCENTSMSFTLTDRDVSTWDVNKKSWLVVKGTFGLLVASASQGGSGLVGSISV